MIIKSLGNNRLVTVKNGQSVTLDFNPVLNCLSNQNFFIQANSTQFLLSHWNKILALPAYFCPQTQEYIAKEEPSIEIKSFEHYWVGVERTEILPSCVLFYPNSEMKLFEEKLIIYPLKTEIGVTT